MAGTEGLRDSILQAFDEACTGPAHEVALSLLDVCADLVARSSTSPEHRRGSVALLVSAYEHLWEIRNPGEADIRLGRGH